jgi:hypothetical protein
MSAQPCEATDYPTLYIPRRPVVIYLPVVTSTLSYGQPFLTSASAATAHDKAQARLEIAQRPPAVTATAPLPRDWRAIVVCTGPMYVHPPNVANIYVAMPIEPTVVLFRRPHRTHAARSANGLLVSEHAALARSQRRCAPLDRTALLAPASCSVMSCVTDALRPAPIVLASRGRQDRRLRIKHNAQAPSLLSTPRAVKNRFGDGTRCSPRSALSATSGAGGGLAAQGLVKQSTANDLDGFR